MVKKIRIILSDVGDILFETSSELEKQKKIIHQILKRHGIELTIENSYSLFRPYKILSQTIISEEEALTSFFSSQGIKATYPEYLELMDKQPKEEHPLFLGITETLEYFHSKGLPLYLLTNASKHGKEFYPNLERKIIAQLKERKTYNLNTFKLQNYFNKCVSSKDVGIKKPAVEFFQYVLAQEDSPISFSEVVFIAHEREEILGSAGLGMTVIAFNYQQGKDAKLISRRIMEHNIRYKKGLTNSGIYLINNFSDILNVIELNLDL